MKVLIFGLGLHNGGFSAAMYYIRHNYKVTVTDIKSENEFGSLIGTLINSGVQLCLGGHKEEDFLLSDLIVKNPAINPNNYFLTLNSHITTDIIALLIFLQGNHRAHIIAISGTKGKSSTTSMITHVLRVHGERVFMGGNIGVSGYSLIDEIEKFISDEDFYVVLELSSWQIRDLVSYGGKVDVMFDSIIITSLYPDHGDYYKDVASYYREKLSIFSLKAHRRYLSVQAKEVIENLSLEGMSSIGYIETVDVVKRALLDMGLDERCIEKGMASYAGLPHRREVVAVKDSIAWINDSGSTIPEAMNYALSKIKTPYILIFGGSDKHCDIEISLAYILKAYHLILLDGTFTRSKIIPLLQMKSITYSGPFTVMKDAVMEGYRRGLSLKEPITVVLSPGAASFGIFANSDERGNVFKEAVNQLS